jgi:hypothetical protein
MEKNRTAKAGEISFDRCKTPFPVIRTTMLNPLYLSTHPIT